MSFFFPDLLEHIVFGSMSSAAAVEKYTVADEATDVVRDVIGRIFMPVVVYDHQQVPALVNTITDAILSKIVHSRLPRKYIVNCTIVQRNGAGLHTLAACSWNADVDGSYVYKAENKGMICIVTVFGVTM